MIKRSMAVFPAPVVPTPDGLRGPASGDPRWVFPATNNNYVRSKWTGAWGYKIKRVTNSTEYRPGWRLMKVDIDKLILDGWTVSVLSDV